MRRAGPSYGSYATNQYAKLAVDEIAYACGILVQTTKEYATVDEIAPYSVL